eukprot:gb/GECG01011222.1/.p1 GENE.gb/GECG01011222.1/~~gb/GECG01011222.1/.p1  ORF type:complete len:488 (+),score=44.38 gb/GECG01011222.1/:1-1464(+)
MYFVCIDIICAACCTWKACCSCGASSQRSAKATKLVYVSIILLASIASICFRFVGLDAIDSVLDQFKSCSGKHCLRNQAVMRTSLSVFIFFLGMILAVTINVRYHLGAWLWKLLAWIALFVICLFAFPHEFFKVYTWISRVGSMLFLMVQVLMLIDFAYDFQEYALDKIKERDNELHDEGIEPGCLSNHWKVVYVFVSGSLFIAAVVGHGIMVDRFGGCFEGLFFSVESLVAGILLTGLSISAGVGAGLLPPSMVFVNLAVYTWGAVSNNPDTSCNPGLGSGSTWRIIIGLILAIGSICWGSFRAAGSAYDIIAKTGGPPNTFESISDNRQGTADDNGYQEANSASDIDDDSYAEAGDGSAKEENADEESGESRGDIRTAQLREAHEESGSDNKAEFEEEEEKNRINDADPQAVSYHVIMAISGLYIGMLFTNWGDTNADLDSSDPELSNTAMWTRMGAVWAIQLIFLWTLVAPKVGPVICPGRSFE